MANLHDTPGALEALQEEIYREKILRARKMTVEDRLADVFELSNTVMVRMHEGAMWQLKITEPGEGWKVVRQRLDRLQKVYDQGLFTSERPVPAHDH